MADLKSLGFCRTCGRIFDELNGHTTNRPVQPESKWLPCEGCGESFEDSVEIHDPSGNVSIRHLRIKPE